MTIPPTHTAKHQQPVLCVVTTIILLLFGFSSRAQNPHSVSADSTIYFEVRFLPGDSVRLIPEKGDDILTGTVSKKVDLNFDGLDDLIVYFPETCGNWGDCVYAIYVQKENGKYICVFREYWFSEQWDLLENECNVVDGVRWMKLRLYSRTDYGGDPPGWIPTSFLQFDGKRYQDIALQSLGNWPKNIDKTETFGVEKEYQYQGNIYQTGRLLLKDLKYGPLTLRIIKDGNSRDISALMEPMDEYPNLEMSTTCLIQLHSRPFFLVIDRYHAYLIDLEREEISGILQPGLGVEYGEDAISGTVSGFQFFDHDKYLIGYAVSYGPFCFNISNLSHPRELQRYTAQYGDSGQPYFFLEQQPNGRWNGFTTQSDTLRDKLFKGIKNTRFLFQDALLNTPKGIYADPADYEIGHPEPFLLLQEIVPMPNAPDNPQAMDLQPWVIDLKPWVIDLKKGELLKGKAAQHFLDSLAVELEKELHPLKVKKFYFDLYRLAFWRDAETFLTQQSEAGVDVYDSLQYAKLTTKQKRWLDSLEAGDNPYLTSYRSTYWGSNWEFVTDPVDAKTEPAIYDFNLATYWHSAKGSDGVGEKITLVFRPVASSNAIKNIHFFSGNMRTPAEWKKFSRPKEVKLFVDGKEIAILHLKNEMAQQSFGIPKMADYNGEKEIEITFEILSVYPGTTFIETAVSEINFDGTQVL